MGNSVLPSVRLDEGLPAASAQPCGSPCAAHLDWHLCGLWARAAGSQVVGLMCGPWAHLAGYPGSPPLLSLGGNHDPQTACQPGPRPLPCGSDLTGFSP